MLLGSSGVGKTSFKSRFLWDEFKDVIDPTMGASRHVTTRCIANISLTIELWDTGNIERYNSFVPTYLDGCACVIILYDITDQDTFSKAVNLLKLVKKHVPNDTIIIVAGNKGDLGHKREVSKDSAEEKCKLEYGCHMFEMSCKDTKGVHQPLLLLNGLIEQMVESLVSKHVPIPRAKPKLPDAMSSSALSRNAEANRAEASRAEAKARAIEAERVAAAAAEGVKNSPNGEEHPASDTAQAQGGGSAGALSPSPTKSWWEGSPYVKKIGDEYIFSCAERLAKTSECISVELTVTKLAIVIENIPSSSMFPFAPVEGLFRFLSRREYNLSTRACAIKVSVDTHHPHRLEIWIKRRPFGLLDGLEVYEEDICVIACPLRNQLIRVLKENLPPSTVFGTNSHSLTRSDFLQVYREHCRFTKVSPYRPVEDQILLDSARSDEPFSRLDISRVLRDSKQLVPVLEGMRWNASVQHLDISINNLGFLGLTYLCRVSHTFYTITSIDLSDNKLGKESSPFLATLMLSIPGLKTFLVDSNNLCDVSAIGTYLFTNTSLTTLGLSHNNIASDSVLTFARALVINTTLVSLDLSSNLLTEEVSMPLLNALSCNVVLTRLCVLGNPDLNEETILNLTLPKEPRQASASVHIKSEEDTENGVVGNAGTPLISPKPDLFEEICEKCKIERMARRKYAPQTITKCTHTK